MIKKLLFEKYDGTTSQATITTKKENRYYASTIKIGIISRCVNSGMLHKNDSYGAAVQLLGYYKEHAVI